MGRINSVNDVSATVGALLSELMPAEMSAKEKVEPLSIGERTDPYRGAFVPGVIELAAPGSDKIESGELESVRAKLVKVPAESGSSASSGDASFDIYQIMQCVLEAAQVSKNAHRQVRKAELDNDASAILSEADQQIGAAKTSLVFGLAGGAVSVVGQAGGIVSNVKSFDTKQTVLNDCGVKFFEGEDHELMSALGDQEKAQTQFAGLVEQLPEEDRDQVGNFLFDDADGNIDPNIDLEDDPRNRINRSDMQFGGRLSGTHARNNALMNQHRAELRQARIEGKDCSVLEKQIQHDELVSKAHHAKEVLEFNKQGFGGYKGTRLAFSQLNQAEAAEARSKALADIQYLKADRDVNIATNASYLAGGVGQTFGGVGMGLGEMKRAEAYREECRAKVAEERKTQAKEFMDANQQIIDKVVQTLDQCLKSVHETNKSIMTRG